MIKRISYVVIILALLLSGCGSSDDYALIIDGEKISIEEYNVYLDEQIKSFEAQGGSDIWEIDFDGVPAQEVAKQNAINSIVMVKAAAKHADQLGVSLTEEEIEQAHKNAEEIYGQEGNTELYNKIMEEAALQNKVYENITDSYQINNQEFEAYFESYYTQKEEEFTKYIVKEIFIQSSDSNYTKDEVNTMFNEINSQSDFDALAQRLFPDTPIAEQELDQSLYSSEVVDKITAASQGDFVLAEDSTGYHIFSIISIEETPMDTLKEELKAQYIEDKKTEIYKAQNDSWTASMTVEKNNNVI